MKLEVIRIAIRNYDRRWRISKYLQGEQDKIARLKDFAEQLDRKDDYYELNSDELYNLLQIIQEKSSLQEIIDLKCGFNPGFLRLFGLLERDRLINTQNLQEIQNLDYNKKLVLTNLFDYDTIVPEELKKVLLDTMLYVFEHDLLSASCNICTYIHHLKKYDVLEESTITILRDVGNEMFGFLCYTEALTKVGQLNVNNICTDVSSDYFSLKIFLNTLADLNVQVSSKIITLSLKHDNISKINKHLKYLKKANFTITSGIVMKLLNSKNKHYFIMENSLSLLGENKVLDLDIYKFVCTIDALYQNKYFDIFQALIKNKLFENNKDFIFNKLELSKSWDFSCNLKYLSNIGLLNQKTFVKCYKRIFVAKFIRQLEQYRIRLKTKDLRILFKASEDKIDNIDGLIKLIVNKGKRSDIKLNYSIIKVFLFMTKTDLYRLNNIVRNLIRTNMLSLKNMLIAANKIKARLPKVEQTTVDGELIEVENQSRCKFVIGEKNQSKVIFSDVELYSSGSFGGVWKCYSSPDSKEVSYNMKVFKGESASLAELEAIREVKYNKLFGREAYYIKAQDELFMIATWQRDIPMNKLSEDKIIEISLISRLKCLNHLLQQINELHQLYRVHQDIKSSNIIFNFDKLEMNVVDFGTSHKRNTHKHFAATQAYSLVGADSFAHDICATGLVAAQLFPELYSLCIKNNLFDASVKDKNDFSILEQAILQLVNCMLETDKTKQCTSEDALNYSKRVLEIFGENKLSEHELENIAKYTIYRTNMTVEDVIRERLRFKS